MNTTIPRRIFLGVACLVTTVSLTACGDDAETVADAPSATTAPTVSTPATIATTVAATVTTDAPATTATTVATPATVATTIETTVATDAPTTTDGSDLVGETVVVTAADYHFEGLPETVPAGTKISLMNDGNEPHEFVAMRIPDEETRSVEELLKLPEEELGAIFGAAAPATVILAATGQTDVPGPVVGDGTLTEPGRYAIVCFLPLGSNDSILESQGPPQGDGSPHAMHGMFAELTVVP